MDYRQLTTEELFEILSIILTELQSRMSELEEYLYV